MVLGQGGSRVRCAGKRRVGQLGWRLAGILPEEVGYDAGRGGGVRPGGGAPARWRHDAAPAALPGACPVVFSAARAVMQAGEPAPAGAPLMPLAY